MAAPRSHRTGRPAAVGAAGAPRRQCRPTAPADVDRGGVVPGAAAAALTRCRPAAAGAAGSGPVAKSGTSSVGAAGGAQGGLDANLAANRQVWSDDRGVEGEGVGWIVVGGAALARC